MDYGKIHCFLVATKTNDVIYERFYDRLSEYDKADIRAAFSTAAGNVRMSIDEQDFVAPYKSARFVFMPLGDTVYYLLGSGEYDELALADTLRTLIGALKDSFSRAPTAAMLFDRYARLVLIVDELINEGMLETTERDSIKKGVKAKAPWE